MAGFKAICGMFGAVVLLASCSEPELILPGERLDLRADLDAPAVDRIDQAASLSLPAQSVNANWTHRVGTPSHTTLHPAFSTAPQPLWAVDIGQGDSRRHRITADPVVADGRIFTVDSRSLVSAHGVSGNLLWSTDVTPPSDRTDDASGAGLAVSGNRVFVSSGFGTLTALDAGSGAVVWTQDLDAAAAGAPTAVGDLVYLVSRDARGWAIDAASGRVRWSVDGIPSASGVVGGAAPAVTDSLAIFPFANGELIGASRQDGAGVWRTPVAGQRPGRAYARISDISGDPVVVGGTVYAGSPAGRTAAMDLASGAQLWSAKEGAMSPVSVFGGSVFTVSDRAELVRLDAGTGARIWGSELPYYTASKLRRRKAIVGNYGPVLAGGQLWVGSGDGQLRAFNPETGALSRSVPIKGGASTNPVVAGRTMYVVSGDGVLHAFR